MKNSGGQTLEKFLCHTADLLYIYFLAVCWFQIPIRPWVSLHLMRTETVWKLNKHIFLNHCEYHLQRTAKSWRTIAFSGHVVTDGAVLTRTFFGTVYAKIVRQTFLRAVCSHPARQTFALSVVRITRRSVLTLTVFCAKFAKLSRRTRYTTTKQNTRLLVWPRLIINTLK